MKKEMLISGLLGGLVIILWILISSTIIPLSGDQPEEFNDDKEIHAMLKERIPETGIYWLPSDKSQFSDYEDEPLFFIYYPGTTPSNSLSPMAVEILLIFLAPMIAAWLLSRASMKVLAKYARRVVFVAVIGLLFAVYGDIFSQKPLHHMLLSSISNLIVWILVGLVLAWRIDPKRLKLNPTNEFN